MLMLPLPLLLLLKMLMTMIPVMITGVHLKAGFVYYQSLHFPMMS